MQPTKWFERKFDFSTQENIFPSIIARLRETPTRLEEKTNGLSEEILVRKIDNKWSIKENIGHLMDLEPLWVERLEDILNGEKFLRATDLQNSKTDLANHNSKSLKELLRTFSEMRLKTVKQITELRESQIFLSALHPRLKTPMRTMDHFLFVAEHDDHHLETIQQIIDQLSK